MPQKLVDNSTIAEAHPPAPASFQRLAKPGEPSAVGVIHTADVTLGNPFSKHPFACDTRQLIKQRQVFVTRPKVNAKSNGNNAIAFGCVSPMFFQHVDDNPQIQNVCWLRHRPQAN